MLNDAVQAIIQMFSPPLRAVLCKSIGLALVLIVAVGAVLERLIVHLIGAGSTSVETTFGPQAHAPASVIAWLLSIAASFGIVAGSVMLMPAVTAIVGSFFADRIADEYVGPMLFASPLICWTASSVVSCWCSSAV